MDLLVRAPTPQIPATARPRRRKGRQPGSLVRLAWPTLLSAVPFGALAWLAHGVLFLSNDHAATVSKALLAADRGRLEFIGFTYPPLPFLLAMPRPSTLLLGLEGALIGGATVVTLWRALSWCDISKAMRCMVVAAAVATPAYAFVTTQAIGEAAVLLLVLWAWMRFQQFVFEDRTSTGLQAGLLLGAAFYFSFIAIVYALLIAALTPTYLSMSQRRGKSGPEAVARAWAVLFPSLVALGAWTYLNWLFRGDAFGFFSSPSGPLRPMSSLDPGALTGLVAAARATLGDLAVVPTYAVVAVLVARSHALAMVPFLAPAALIWGVRAAGLTYPETFAISTLALVAVMTLRWVPVRRFGAALLAAATAAQIAVGIAAPLQSPEVALWRTVTFSGERRPGDVQELQIAKRLRSAPPRSILADDRSAYRLIARGGSARPFVLPADAEFEVALSAPVGRVEYVLVSLGGIAVADQTTRRYANGPPAGFVVDVTWPGWILYRHARAPSLFGGVRAGEL